MTTRALLVVSCLVVGCGGAPPATSRPPADAVARPSDAPAAAPPAGADRCAPDPTADRGLDALVGQGRALADHVGPAAAAAIDADLAARPAVYLARIACRYVDPDPTPALASLFVELPLWKLRAHAPEPARALAARLGHRLEELGRAPADPADPGFAARLAARVDAVALIVGGVDVAPGPGWTAVAAADVAACVTATPDGATVVRVTRSCSCGETLGCRATATAAGLDLAVAYDPRSPAICTDCYPTTTACTLPALPPRATITVRGIGVAPARWTTDALGRPDGPICR
ncbi:MAG: hypothetical protein JNK64_18595 [Myxococcales bacterium]|nr:hypothetical protein [Myxococcales bacterium]